MMDSGTPAHEPPSSAVEPEKKRRKIRKGTRSCWECKRRKNKCTWSRGEDNCDSCHRRGTRCISQEFPEEHVRPEKGRSDRLDGARLQHVEALIEKLVREVGAKNGLEEHLELLSEERSDNPQPPESGSMSVSCTLQPSLPKTVSFQGQLGAAADNWNRLTRALVAVWPSKDVLNAILDIPISNIGALHPAISIPCSGFDGHHPTSPRDLLQLPPPESTPIAIARKLLILGMYLQVILSHSEKEVVIRSTKHHGIMSCVLEAVARLVTHNDNLPCSVDIIECLIIESQYYNYKGNVRRAWIIIRRAMAMAQLIGLDRQNNSLSLDTHTNEVQARLRMDNTWFLLIHIDQYLSLMLGTWPSLVDDCHAAPKMWERLTPTERMGRLHSAAAGSILQRNRINTYDLVKTKDIDKVLQQAAACMPAQWWLPPDLTSNERSDEESYYEILRLMVHFTHYNLLLQLHMPYLLRFLSGQRYHSSTLTAITASREVLIRFTAFRSCHPVVSYSRGLDFFAFMASAALCLMHIHGGCMGHDLGDIEGGSISDLLAHQRLPNRGLVERALENIENIARTHIDDTITSGIVTVFRNLLAIENEAAKGASYSIRLLSTTRRQHNRSWKVTDSDNALYIDLPFCDTIKVERSKNPQSTLTAASTSGATAWMIQTAQESSLSDSVAASYATTFPVLQAQEDHHEMITNSYHSEQYQPDSNNVHVTSPQPYGMPAITYTDNETQDSGLLAANVMESADKRAIQSIDADFFEGLIDLG
ncbi:hypothetical protein F5Y19DRAFT_118846 [Xylariaceae sp. FL1651]|nr:hypothetical protein F5Y19DRAFT_118846 [Xylariaceae sp. FL1651]